MNLQQLLDAIQIEKYATQPLAAHRIAELPEHTREQYALLLAAVLRVNPAISAAQSRVFVMLLESMELANHQAALFERAQNLTAADLSESRRQIVEQELMQSFLLDSFILLRLDKPLTDDNLRLCAELADLLQVSSETLSDLVALTLHVLGINTLPISPLTLDFLYPQWYEFFGEKLTITKLQEGVTSGLWVIDRVIEMDTGWTLENATLIFAKGGQLNTNPRVEANITIHNCKLINPVMQFTGINSQSLFEMQNSHVQGRYSEQARLTALYFENIGVTIKNTRFSTQNARSIHAVNSPITLEKCQFTDCGSRLLVGGALAIRRRKAVSLDDCDFIRCCARLGGALRIDELHYNFILINKCTFAKCSATEPNMDYGIYANQVVTSREKFFITSSQFECIGVYLGDRTNGAGGGNYGHGFLARIHDDGNYDYVFSVSKLIEAKMHANMRYPNEFREGITLTGNSEILTEITHQLPAWAEDF